MERIRSAIQKAKVAREAMGLTDGHEPQFRSREERLAEAPENGAAPAPQAVVPQAKTNSGAPVLPASWGTLEVFAPKPKLMTQNRIVSFDQKDPSYVSFDMMRTKVLSACRANKWKTIAITSPTPECGKTLTSVNLAFSLARQKDARTVLMDLDLRRPMVAEVLGISAPHSMGRFLEGEDPVGSHFLRYNDTLAIGSNNRRTLHSAEILQDSKAADAMALLNKALNPDIILVDLPPMMAADDVMAFLPNVDAVLLVASAGTTVLRDVDDCERELAERTEVMGVILNKCRFNNEVYAYGY